MTTSVAAPTMLSWFVDKTLMKRASIDSFRRMTLQEAQNAKPLRIKVVSVGLRDTIDTMSRRMATGDKKRETFLVLNGLNGGESLATGSLVKIVVE